MNHSGILKIAMAKTIQTTWDGSTFVNFRLGVTNINWVMNCLQTILETLTFRGNCWLQTFWVDMTHVTFGLLEGRVVSLSNWGKNTHRIKANHRVNQSTSDVICFVPKKSRGFGEIYSNKMLKLIAKGDTRKNQWMLWKASFRHVSVDRLSILWSITRVGSCFGKVAWPWPINLFSFVGFMFISFRIHVLHGLNINPCHKKASKPKPEEVPMVNKLHATHLRGSLWRIWDRKRSSEIWSTKQPVHFMFGIFLVRSFSWPAHVYAPLNKHGTPRYPEGLFSPALTTNLAKKPVRYGSAPPPCAEISKRLFLGEPIQHHFQGIYRQC